VLYGVPATTVLIATALSIARPTTTSLGAAAVNLGGGAAHAMPACRIYYSKIKLDPVKALTFIQENTTKEIVIRMNTQEGGPILINKIKWKF
jgi:hypothetical protein